MSIPYVKRDEKGIPTLYVHDKPFFMRGGEIHNSSASDSAFLDLWDFIVSNNLLPLGSLIIVLFCASKKWGWGWDRFIAEANTGKGLKVKNWMRYLFCYIVPVAIIIIYIVGLITFKWSD